MVSLKGTGVFQDIVVGRLVFNEREPFQIQKEAVQDAGEEMLRYLRAKEQALLQVQALHELAKREVSSENAAIFQAHHMMLEDQDFNNYVLDIIRNQQANAEYAVQQTARSFYEVFSALPDPYLQQRAADILDVSHRLISILTYGKVEHFEPSEPSILASEELVPSEVIQIPREKVLAFVTRSGSETSHAAIITKDRNIPYLLGVGEQLHRQLQGHVAAVDTYAGRLYIDPDELTLRRLREKKRREEEKLRGLSYLIGKPNRTIDGREIHIYASITEPLDIEQVIRSDADGLGLMRSEFLYLKRPDLPSEEEQVNAYREVIRQMNGKRTVIRTLDFGARKLTEQSISPNQQEPHRFPLQLKQKPEVNPSMGFRSIRICLAKPEMFQTQLRAIYRASVYGPVSILFPMVDSVEQLEQILSHVHKAQESLVRDALPFDPKVGIGLVIETPASVILSPELAQKVNFFHIDTNDLVQYTLAVDRQNPRVTRYYNTHHPAVMRMIQMVIAAAHNAGIQVTISGDMADDESLLGWFIRSGVDGINVSAASVLPLRRRVRNLDLNEG